MKWHILLVLPIILSGLLLSSCATEEDHAKGGAEEIITKKLKAPSTAKFSETHIVDMKHKEDEDVYLVATTVDAQNGFGAMLRSHYLVVLYIKKSDSSSVSWNDDIDINEISDSEPTKEEITNAKFLSDWH